MGVSGTQLVMALAALAVGAAAAWLLVAGAHRSARARLEERLAGREEEIVRLRDELQAQERRRRDLEAECADLRSARAADEATVRAQREAMAERMRTLEEAKSSLSDAFRALAAEALTSNTTSFLALAQSALERLREETVHQLSRREQAIGELVQPVRESLERMDGHIRRIEAERAGAYASLTQEVRSLAEGELELRRETSRLVQALRAPVVRGRWGEVQLRRVVELSGMVQHCDFSVQSSMDTPEGRLRPDLLVHLPGGRLVVVDAKAPLAAYLEALEAPDEATRIQRLGEHARQVRERIVDLSRKAYFAQFQPTPDFVVLFLPAEPFFSAALEQDPDLIELGAQRQVVLATPTTLIALLRAVAYGWRQEALAENARAISELGAELYKRLGGMTEPLARLGRHLGTAVRSYNETVGSLEARVLVTARRLKELGAGQGELDAIEGVELLPRRPQEQAGDETPTASSAR